MEQKKEDKGKLEGLPTETSPYTQYKDLEDYKEKGYGTQGQHQQPNPGRGAGGSTDAPTVAGGGSNPPPPPSQHSSSTDVINRQGVP